MNLIFKILELAERRGRLVLCGKARSYCDGCKSRHFRYWYREVRTGDCVYVCSVKEVGIVSYVSGSWSEIGLADLANHLLSG